MNFKCILYIALSLKVQKLIWITPPVLLNVIV